MIRSQSTRRQRSVIVLGAGLGGLTAAALLARAGQKVTVLEGSDWIGGKSRRMQVGGQTVDTGPALVSFPAVWREVLDTYDRIGARRSLKPEAEKVANVTLTRLSEIGRYMFRNDNVILPVPAGHPWHKAWQRFEREHGGLGKQVSSMLTTNPTSLSSLPAVRSVFKKYGVRLTTRAYLDGLTWMPEGLREVIAIHTLNAGISPQHTLALYASIPAIMARDGIWVPEGGVNELPLALHRLAIHAGADIHLGEPVTAVSKGSVTTEVGSYKADVVVSSLDPSVLDALLGRRPKPTKALSCSGVAIYASLKKELPKGTATHSIVMPDDPTALHRSLDRRELPDQTMAFLNYYRPHEIYDNTRATVALLLAAPADGKTYTLDHPWVQREIQRVSTAVGLGRPITVLFNDHVILDPHYFGEWGSIGGALYGATTPFWQSGPFHRPSYTSPVRPWLWRVGASVHPGGGIPAVLGGALISSKRLLRYLERH